MLVDVDDYDLHLITDANHIAHRIHVAAGELADMHQAIAAGEDFDERPEVLHATDAAGVDLADLHGRGESFDLRQSRFRPFAVGAGDGDHAAVLDFQHAAGRFLNRPDGLAA